MKRDKKYVHVLLNDDLKKKLVEEANEMSLSLNAYIITILLRRDK